ncbi:MAG TPA: 2,3,4,5-tetrahydropyridine-2,6-dicarboxylate N-succinyltransferase [Myxococcota bacterium]|jgi:2,3,4,5-tetrahydropyridine-2-carboxylate N-succinyltransferase
MNTVHDAEQIDRVMAEMEPFLDMSAPELAVDDIARAARSAFRHFLGLLEVGAVRAAQPLEGVWRVDARVKRGILFGFKLGRLVELGDAALPFVDKDTYPVRGFSLQDRVRVVPGGSSVRRGAHVAPSVTIMPPAYINVGAFVDEGAMVDSHALVGSCAQIGKRVHLSAAAQVGGVLEPVGAVPVVVEDDAFVGGNVGLYEGTLVRTRAVLAAGVILTRSTKVYDLVHEREISADGDKPLEIPAGAVVVPGTRPASGAYAHKLGLHIASPLIIKYRDDKTDAKASLESALRA